RAIAAALNAPADKEGQALELSSRRRHDGPAMRRSPADSPLLPEPIRMPQSVRAPDDAHERRARKRGAVLVAGVDEAGRGPLAGPVVVAAVCFDGRRFPRGLDDSKRLTPAERVRLYDRIMACGSVAVTVASRARIDRMNILRATLWAMARAVDTLPCRPDHVLVDGRDLPP